MRGALVATILLVATLGAAPVASASTDRVAQGATTYLEVTEVTPWVAPDGTWDARFGVDQEPPAGSTLRYTVHRALSGRDVRDRLHKIVAGGALGPTLRNGPTDPLEAHRSGSTVSLELGLRDKTGDPNRVLLPDPGIHPIQVQLVDAAGEVLQEIVLFINRLPAKADRPALRIAPLLTVASPPMIAPDGSTTIAADTRRQIERTTDILDAAADLPITVSIDPQLLSEARRSDDDGDQGRVERLVESVRGRPVLRSPWVPIDVESWARTGTLATFQAGLLAGQLTIGDALGRPADGQVWPPDPSLGPSSIDLLGAVGVQHVILRPEQLAPSKDAVPTDQRVRVALAANAIDALVIEPEVAKRLGDATATPALAAHLGLTELEAMWFAAPANVSPAAIVDLTDVTTATAEEFLAGLATSNETVSASTATDAFSSASAAVTTARRKSEPLIRRLADPSWRDVSAIARQFTRLRARAIAYHSSMSDRPGTAPLDQLLLTTEHRDLDVGVQLQYLGAAGHRMDEDFAEIVPPPSRSFTVTARRSELPLRVVNNLGRDVTVLLRFGGTRLELNGGRSRKVRLDPGVNALRVPVLARTSGDFAIAVELRTADGANVLATTRMRIRSSVVSGVGVLLGGGALLFLIVWWGATIRRDRRRRRAGPDGDGSTVPPDEPDHDSGPDGEDDAARAGPTSEPAPTSVA